MIAEHLVVLAGPSFSDDLTDRSGKSCSHAS
jgi:hypothetical protein